MQIGRSVLLRVTLASLATLLIVCLTLWGVGTLVFRAPFGTALALGFGLSAVVACLSLWRIGPGLAGLVPFTLAMAGLLVWWQGLAPGQDRDWSPQLAQIASVTREADRLTFANVRNFRWAEAPLGGPDLGSGEAIAEARWESRTVDLAAVAGVDLFFSYWTGPSIAHVIVSFPIDKAPPLAFSIEIRRERGESYSALAGFFRSYELAIVAADERDIIRLRTDVWKEDVRLYRLGVSRAKARDLLLGYAGAINDLSVKPRWYHTLTSNCTTVAFALARRLWPSLPLDWRILLPGRAPELAYEIGALDTTLPFEQLRQAAAISGRARALPDDAGFSDAIRAGVPRPAVE